jgi:Family of unknown function (DUF6455)
VSDFCYSFPVFNRVLAQAKVMDAMMEKVGVNPLIAIRRDAGASWSEARMRCIDCVSAGECREWLDAAVCDQPHDAPQFCPNRGFYESCLRHRSQAD